MKVFIPKTIKKALSHAVLAAALINISFINLPSKSISQWGKSIIAAKKLDYEKEDMGLTKKMVKLLINPFSHLRMYKNDALGFEIGYPKDWTVIETAQNASSEEKQKFDVLHESELQKIVIKEESKANKGEFRIRVLSNPSNLSLNEWVNQLKQNSLIKEKNNVSLNGNIAVRLLIADKSKKQIEFVTQKEGVIYLLNYDEYPSNNPTYQKYTEIYSIIVSTFKFSS